jgi:hypothetical protein
MNDDNVMNTEVSVKEDNIVSLEDQNSTVLSSNYPDIDNSFNYRLQIINKCMCEDNKSILTALTTETIHLHAKVVQLNDKVKLLEIIKTNKAQLDDVAKKTIIVNKQIIEEFNKLH